jgi:ribokinase
MPTQRRIARENNLRLSDLAPKVRKLRVSVLPDFFLDRIISVPSLTGLFLEAKVKATAGGGNLRGYSQTEIRGGNATNLAFALAALSARTQLFCVGDALARAATSNRPANLRMRILPGRPGFTVALEFPFKARMVNVMISAVGDLAYFDGSKLDRNAISELRNSDCIALVNWSANRNGNRLTRRVFSLSRRKARLNFLDPADLSGAENRISGLKKIVDDGLIDVISLNENEARILTNALSVSKLPASYRPKDVVRASTELHDALQVSVDIHTPIGGASTHEGYQAWVQSPGFVRGSVTGAGDVWDAGDVIGHLLRFTTDDRLRFANACAYLYVSSRRARTPSLREVVAFLLERRAKTRRWPKLPDRTYR